MCNNVLKLLNEPSDSSSSQLAPGECVDDKLLTIKLLNEDIKDVVVGLIFLRPWLRMHPKKFSTESWLKFLGETYLKPENLSFNHSL